MKGKGKGKIHPSPSPSRSVSGGCFSVLNILPAAILAVIAVLSLEDREVLAFMITRPMSAGTSSSSNAVRESKNNRKGSKNEMKLKDEMKSKKKKKKEKQTAPAVHAPPVFDCDCFDCYTCYWSRWNSSPNREIIHLAIEAFEDPLAKSGRQVAKKSDHPFLDAGKQSSSVAVAGDEGSTVDKVSPANSSEETAAAGEKGLERKVLPGVLVMFNLRLWGLWNPNA